MDVADRAGPGQSYSGVAWPGRATGPPAARLLLIVAIEVEMRRTAAEHPRPCPDARCFAYASGFPRRQAGRARGCRRRWSCPHRSAADASRAIQWTWDVDDCATSQSSAIRVFRCAAVGEVLLLGRGIHSAIGDAAAQVAPDVLVGGRSP